MHLTFQYRVKNNTRLLNRLARKVNYVWNYCNDVQRQAVKNNRKWLTGFDLINLTSGSPDLLGLHSHTINGVCLQYAQSRIQHKKPWLRWRSKKSLGWIPLKSTNIKFKNGIFKYMGRVFNVWMSRPFEGKILDGSSFSQDSQGHWYLNVVCEVETKPEQALTKTVGIDLGLKDLATLSDGTKIENPKYFRYLESKLAKAQRAKKKKQSRKIHAKIKNLRKDFLHKASTKLVNNYHGLAVGNVSSSKLAKTKMAKSIYDTGWSTFKSMLQYKSIRNGCVYKEVNEAFSTQTCHVCGVISGPKGLTGLNERVWSCFACVSVHDRDTNAANNILSASGLKLLQKETNPKGS